MDTDTTGNHASYNQNSGMWKAYGLVYKLLQNGIPAHWAIKPGKNFNDIDFSVTSANDKRTNTALSSWDYRAGPFIIDSANAATATPIIQAWWAAKGALPNVHEAQAGFTADVDIILRSPPRIANEAINAGTTLAYYNAAGIPDLNGNPWTSTSPSTSSTRPRSSAARWAVLRGFVASRFYSISSAYQYTEPSGATVPITDRETLATFFETWATGSSLRQVSIPTFLEDQRSTSDATVIEISLGVRARVRRGMEVLGGFRGSTYTSVAQELEADAGSSDGATRTSNFRLVRRLLPRRGVPLLMSPTAEDVLVALRRVQYPGFTRDIVACDVVKDLVGRS